jgi:hypothetical protein
MPWLVKPGRDPLIVPDYMDDTVERCLREGWVVCPDPRGQAALPEVEPAVLAASLVDADPAETQARADEARVIEMKAIKARNANARKWIERTQ